VAANGSGGAAPLNQRRQAASIGRSAGAHPPCAGTHPLHGLRLLPAHAHRGGGAPSGPGARHRLAFLRQGGRDARAAGVGGGDPQRRGRSPAAGGLRRLPAGGIPGAAGLRPLLVGRAGGAAATLAAGGPLPHLLLGAWVDEEAGVVRLPGVLTAAELRQRCPALAYAEAPCPSPPSGAGWIDSGCWGAC
jgi:hypothetical protein